MGAFRFKQFSVNADGAAMKVGTDAVLLGAATSICGCERAVLDVGTGSGIIALMIAQRLGTAGISDYRITGIEIDAEASAQAADNFTASPWKDKLGVLNTSLSDYLSSSDDQYDLIVSNPPYFEASLLPPDERRSLARHTTDSAFSFIDLLEFAGRKLTDEGKLALIIPAQEEPRLLRYAVSFGLQASRLLRVRTTPRKSPTRLIAEFAKATVTHRTEPMTVAPDALQPCNSISDTPLCREELLTIQDAEHFHTNKNCWTDDYIALTKDFYL